MRGTGTDIIETHRFRETDESVIKRLFTDREISYCTSKGVIMGEFRRDIRGEGSADQGIHHGGGDVGIDDIEIVHNADRCPVAIIKDEKDDRLMLSLSHCSADAVAFVQIERI